MRKAAATLAVLLTLVLAPAAGAWPAWGNIEHGDCAFAAAANWELLHGGTSATEESILAESQAFEPNEEGMSGEDLERYWRVHGIGGRKESIRDASPDRLRVELRRHGPVIAEFAITPKQRWHRLGGAPTPGDTTTDVVDNAGGVHYAVVRYITKRGPVILTWGELAQMTWWQWEEDSLLLYYGD
jgi:hypothetical protein